MIKIGMLGSGSHAQENLLPALSLVEGIELHTFHSRDEDRAREASKTYNVKVFSIDDDPKKLLDTADCDGFVVSATPQVHQDMLTYAIEKNRSIFVEKPPATSLEKMESIVHHLKNSSNPPVVQFGFNFRHSTFYEDIAAMNTKERSIRYMKVKSFASKPDSGMWDYNGIVESSLYAAHIHAIEMVCYTLGTLVNSSHSLVWIDDHKYVLTISALFEDGKQGVIEASNVSNRFEFDVECIDSHENVLRATDFNHIEVFGPDYDAQSLFKPKSIISYDIPFLRGGFDRTGYSQQFVFFKDAVVLRQLDVRSLDSCLDTYKIIEEAKNEQ